VWGGLAKDQSLPDYVLLIVRSTKCTTVTANQTIEARRNYLVNVIVS